MGSELRPLLHILCSDWPIRIRAPASRFPPTWPYSPIGIQLSPRHRILVPPPSRCLRSLSKAKEVLRRLRPQARRLRKENLRGAGMLTPPFRLPPIGPRKGAMDGSFHLSWFYKAMGRGKLLLPLSSEIITGAGTWSVWKRTKKPSATGFERNKRGLLGGDLWKIGRYRFRNIRKREHSGEGRKIFSFPESSAVGFTSACKNVREWQTDEPMKFKNRRLFRKSTSKIAGLPRPSHCTGFSRETNNNISINIEAYRLQT